MKIEIAKGIFIGDDCPVFVIAEGGINHQGDLEIAKKLIKSAKECGADCIKFQKRTIDRILTKEGLNQPYVNRNSFGDTYGEHKRALEFSFDQFKELKKYADEQNILFTASGWDEESIDFLDSINVPFFKLASADLTNHPLLIHTAKKNKPMIISTGMSNMKMVEDAVKLIEQYNHQIVIMHCTSSYPAPFEELNLNVITTFKNKFDYIIGYSSHCLGIAIPFATTIMGAKVIESHFTLDRTMKGGDHAASLEPDGLKKLIRDIHVFEKSTGSFDKTITMSELPCMKKLRKSLVSSKTITKDQIITSDMLTVKGPGTGICPSRMNEIIGKKAKINIDEDIVLMDNYFE